MQPRLQSSLLATAVFLAMTASAVAADQPTDPQIAHIAYTAGELDIRAAQLALEISQNKSVRDFAESMVRDHKAVNDKALALVKKLNVTPEDNGTSKGLAKNAEDKRAELQKLTGAAFDKAYAENEAAYHKSVNGALETTLIPSASNPELKGLLETGLKIFRGHEQHAETMVRELKWRLPSMRHAIRKGLMIGITALASATTALAGDVFTVRITDLAFSPADISVHVGDTVEWINDDFVEHTATATEGEFDITIATNARGRLQVRDAGTFGYYCRFHPGMTGSLRVDAK